MKFFKKYSSIIFVAAAFLYVVIPVAGLAQMNGTPSPSFNGTGNTVALENPLGQTTSLCILLQEFLNVLVMFGVPIVVLFLVYSGFLFVKARGNPKELMRANKNFRYVILGIFLFLGAWMLGQIVASTINTLGAGSNAPGVGSCRN